MFVSGRVFNGSGKPIDRGPPVLAEDFLDIQGKYNYRIIYMNIFEESNGFKRESVLIFNLKVESCKVVGLCSMEERNDNLYLL